MKKAKFLITGLLLVAAAVAGGVAYVRSIDFDSYRPALVGELRAATGRDVAIDGPVSLALLPRPRFVLRSVAIANAPWGTRDSVARVERVEAYLSLPDLLRGQRKVNRLRLVRPDLWLETDSVGKVNWVLAGGAAPTAGNRAGRSGGLFLGLLDVGRIDIVGGRATYRDGATGDITLLTARDASVEGDGYEAPLALRFAGEWDTVPVALAGEVGPYNAIASEQGDASVVNLRLEVGDAAVRIDGTVGDPERGPGAALRIVADVPDAGRLARRFGIALPLSRPVTLETVLDYRGTRVDLRETKVAIGDAPPVTGTASLDLAPARPVFKADIHAPEIDLGGLAPASRVVTAGEVGALDTLIGSGLLSRADGTVTLHADALRAGPATLREIEARVAVADGGIAADRIRARAIGGRVEGSVRLDTASSPPRLSLSVKAPAFAVGPLLQRSARVKAFGGVAAVAASLSTVAGTPEDMLAGLQGEALLAMGEGRLSLEPYETPFAAQASAPSDLVGLLVAEGQQQVALDCVAGRLTVEGPIVRTEGLVLLSADSRVKGQGKADLGAGTMALRLMPEARNGPLMLDKTVSVAGSLRSPVLTVSGPPRASGTGALSFFPLRRFFAGVASNPAANACLRALPPPPRRRARVGQPIAQRPKPKISEDFRSSPPPRPGGPVVDQTE